MSGLIAIIVTIVLAVILIKVTFKLLGIAIAIAIGVAVYFIALKLFGRRHDPAHHPFRHASEGWHLVRFSRALFS